jgi:dTDP-4-amino-4,6-dideoxygalactose transaminase
VPAHAEPAWHLYVVAHPRADAVIAGLAERGIQARGYYRVPIHRQPAMAPFAEGTSLPMTDELAGTNLALPMSPVLGGEQAQAVVAALAEVS